MDGRGLVAVYQVTRSARTAPGTVADAGKGDVVEVFRDAPQRADWAGMSRAVMAAFVRGADVVMEGAGQ